MRNFLILFIQKAFKWKQIGSPNPREKHRRVYEWETNKQNLKLHEISKFTRHSWKWRNSLSKENMGSWTYRSRFGELNRSQRLLPKLKTMRKSNAKRWSIQWSYFSLILAPSIPSREAPCLCYFFHQYRNFLILLIRIRFFTETQPNKFLVTSF